MTVIFEKPVEGPATHALVLGVGYYAHLLGGGAELFPDHEGLKQLTSPPHSARAFANWLLTSYYNPEKPLASLDLLVSEREESIYSLPDGEVKAVERATFDRVKDGLNRWFARGNDNLEDLLILFFCGHGVAKGLTTTLLMEDFGKIPYNPLDHALDFTEFYGGMDICQARLQCYFIDACRTASPALLTRYNNFTGHSVIPGSANLATLGKRKAPIFYATVPGTTAFGRTGQPSVFTEALLKAMQGAGSNDDEEMDNWRVDTDTLNRGLDHWLQLIQGEASATGQIVSVDELTRFTLHHLKTTPTVPVSVGCQPPEATGRARLSYSKKEGAEVVPRLETQAIDWLVELENGRYSFSADFSSGGYTNQQKDCEVRPPYRKVYLKVAG